MKYNLADPKELKAARNRISYLAKKGKKIDLTGAREERTLNQNSYLHLLLADFAMEFGYNLEEAKMIYKGVNKDIYYYIKNGLKFIRSSASISKAEMAQTIDKFIEYSAMHGHPLPPADNAEWRSLVEKKIFNNRRYL